METISVAGIDLAYTMSGSGDPVMLLAGLSGKGSGWAPHPDRFAAQFTTIVPDHPGTGGSGVPEHYTLTHHAEVMSEAITRLGVGPTHIVGSSTGGAIALLMALDHPNVVRSIVAVSAWSRADSFFRRQFSIRKDILSRMGVGAYAEASALFLHSPRFVCEYPEQVATWIEGASGASADVMADRIDMIMAHDVHDRLGDIRVPTLVVVGTEDFCTPPHLSEELAAHIPGARLEFLEGGHLIYKEAPDAFHRAVREFLLSV